MSKATGDIDRTIFNKNDQRTEDLHLQLSAKYMVYKDLADRVILNPTQMGKATFLTISLIFREKRSSCVLHTTRYNFYSGAQTPEPVQK